VLHPVCGVYLQRRGFSVHVASEMIKTFVAFELFTAVVMKSIIFWDMMPCSPLSFNGRFGRTYRLYLQGRRNRFSKTSKQAGVKQKLNGLHSVMSQKMILFIKTFVYVTKNPFRLYL
jgi:hypothetical protein